jgi:hypothetical protein
MGLRQDGEAGKLSPGDLQLGQAAGPICSLNEAWFHALNKCVTDIPLSESILPLMRSCFFGGAMHAVFLLQKGYDDQLASDIAGFILEQAQS